MNNKEKITEIIKMIRDLYSAVNDQQTVELVDAVRHLREAIELDS